MIRRQRAYWPNEYGDTSFATPMWAGFIGLVNPQNVKSTYSTGFHDITSGTSGSYSAVTGYDLVTGWGSPKAGLITTLAPEQPVVQVRFVSG